MHFYINQGIAEIFHFFSYFFFNLKFRVRKCYMCLKNLQGPMESTPSAPLAGKLNQVKGRKKCHWQIHDYLKKNKLIDATFGKIWPHCVYPQVSAVKKWERHVRFIHSSSNNQLFWVNELICWLILGVQFLSFFTSKRQKLYFSPNCFLTFSQNLTMGSWSRSTVLIWGSIRTSNFKKCALDLWHGIC